jgi:hypothetical protein
MARMSTPDPLTRWTAALAEALGVDADVDLRLLLDVAREAAHAVDRPAAPVSTYLVGLAAARAGGGEDAVRAAADTVRRLAAEWDLGLEHH